jgi:hypothetical protein
VVAGCHAFHRDLDRMLLHLARGGDAGAYHGPCPIVRLNAA